MADRTLVQAQDWTGNVVRGILERVRRIDLLLLTIVATEYTNLETF